MKLSVIVPTFNPDAERLRRTLEGLRLQSLPSTEWDTVIVNNASTRFPEHDFFAVNAPQKNCSIIFEPTPGLTSARKCGLHVARGEVVVMVDDDNVLAPDYLENTLEVFAADPRLGAIGGKSQPEFEIEPSDWMAEFLPLLALRDLGSKSITAEPATGFSNYPRCAPIGAGMALRREAWEAWMRNDHGGLSDRRGGELTSAGDNDIVFSTLKAGMKVGYFPDLQLTHLIPASRLTPEYLGRLNRGIQKSWMQVLAVHDACPWPSVAGWTVPLRILKAWLKYRAWAGSCEWIRWQGVCGQFEGLSR